jgi:hypothetical protein
MENKIYSSHSIFQFMVLIFMLISVTKSDNTKYESENVDLSKLLEYNCEFCSLLEESEIECEKSNECIEVF